MSIPNGESGLPTEGLEWAYTANGSITGAANRTRANVEPLIKQQVKNSSGWNSANSAAYAGLAAHGVPLVANIILTVANELTGLVTFGLFDLSDILDALRHIPFLGQFIPPLDASKITSGSFASNMIDGLDDILDWATDSIHNTILTLSKWLGGFFRAFTGSDRDDDDITAEEAAEVAAQAAADQIANATAIARLEAAVDGVNNSGISGGDDFQYIATAPDGDLWAETYSDSKVTNGHVEVDGEKLIFITEGSHTQNWWFRAIWPEWQHTTTLYQRVVAVIGAFTGDPAFGTSAYIRLRCRLNDAETEEVFCDIRTPNKEARFGYRVGGVDTYVGSWTDVGGIGAGTTFTLVAGTPGSLRQFQLLKNNAPKVSWNDSGALSAAVDGSNNGWGHGGRAQSVVGGTVRPLSIDSITVADNAPAPLVGSGMQVMRASTSSATISGAVPNNFYDTVEYCSPDIIWDAVNSQATVTKNGWYAIDCGFWNTATIPETNAATVLIEINGAEKRRLANSVYAPTSGSDNPSITVDTELGGACHLYLQAGDIVSNAVTGANITVAGNSAGSRAYFSIVRIW